MTNISGDPEIDVYPVGVLDTLLMASRALRASHPQAIRHALGRLKGDLRILAGRVRAGQWRAVKNALNGYLAEPAPWPDGLRRCGSGWTRRRALRSLRRQMRRDGITR